MYHNQYVEGATSSTDTCCNGKYHQSQWASKDLQKKAQGISGKLTKPQARELRFIFCAFTPVFHRIKETRYRPVFYQRENKILRYQDCNETQKTQIIRHCTYNTWWWQKYQLQVQKRVLSFMSQSHSKEHWAPTAGGQDLDLGTALTASLLPAFLMEGSGALTGSCLLLCSYHMKRPISQTCWVPDQPPKSQANFGSLHLCHNILIFGLFFPSPNMNSIHLPHSIGCVNYCIL